MYLLVCVILRNFKNILKAVPELWRCVIFGYTLGAKRFIYTNKKFLRKTSKIVFMYLLAHFTMQNFKRILKVDLELLENFIFWPKISHLPRQEPDLLSTSNLGPNWVQNGWLFTKWVPQWAQTWYLLSFTQKKYPPKISSNLIKKLLC